MQGEENMKMTYDEYDTMLEMFKQLTVKTYYPDPVEIDKMSEDPDKWIKFVCYLYEQGEKPRNQKERYSRENLKDFIQKNLELEDSAYVNISLCSPVHGTISFSGSNSDKFEIGSTCTLQATPNPGYQLMKLSVLDGLFQKKHICDIDETLSFVVPDMDVYVYAEFKEAL